jgi:uncharacterized protein
MRLLLVFGLIILGLHLSPRVRSLYKLPEASGEPLFALREVVAGFAIYLGAFFLLGPLLGNALWKAEATTNTYAFLPPLVLSLILLLFSLLCRPGDKTSKLWQSSHAGKAFLLGVALWVIAFPVVNFVAEAGDLFVNHVFHLRSNEQDAVTFLKRAMSHPQRFVAALFTVLLLAPLTEEWLFRGMLLTYLKDRLGSRKGLFLSAAIFASFHMAKNQGAGNIPLFLALFPLGCYLGLLYLREKTLLAPLGLHMTFNAGTTLYLLFNQGLP